MSIGERLSIGLLLRDEQNLHFRYSEHKLMIIKNLLDEGAFSLVESYLKNLQKEIEETKNSELKDLLNDSYLNYLSRYANNILSFSAPESLSMDKTDDFFSSLYSEYIFDDKKVENFIFLEAKKALSNFKPQSFGPEIISGINPGLYTVIVSCDGEILHKSTPKL